MKLKKVGLLLMAGAMLAPLATAMPVSASTKRIPKTYRGKWVSKPVYTYQRKHTKKNMAMPKFQLKITSKTVQYQAKGYLPKGYNHKVYKLKVKKVYKHLVDLKGKGPYGKVNFLTKHGKKLDWSYQYGGEIWFKKLK